MANSKLIDLTADTTPSSSDLGYTLKDPGGTPLDRKATWLNILKGAALGVLTSDGDLFTRAAGALTRITRASLAADSAFSSLYAPVAGSVGGPPTFARKTADQSVTSSTVLVNDNHLSFSVTASAVYATTLVLLFTGNSSGDLKYTWSLPTGGTWGAAGPYVPGSATAITTVQLDGNGAIPSGTAASIGTVTGEGDAIVSTGLMVMSGTGGTAQFQWAQNTSNGTATTLKTNSFVMVHRVA